MVMADDFETAAFCGKRATLSNWRGKKTGATAQPCYNGFRAISDRIITALQCIWQNKLPSVYAIMCSHAMVTGLT